MKLGDEILWLTDKDVLSLVTMKEALSVVEEGFRRHGEGAVQMPPKVYLDFEPFAGDLRAMPGYLKGDKPAAGVKIVNSNPKNSGRNLPAVSGIMVSVDPPTGLPLAVFSARALTQLRTGAAGGVAARYCARKDSKSVGLIGCGGQAPSQLAALTELFPIEKVSVWGKTKTESETFVASFQGAFKATLCSVRTVEEACHEDILVTTTPVREPIVKKEWIQAGTHINAIGADAPGKQELESNLVQSATIIVDDWEQCSHGGEINVPVAQKRIEFSSKMKQLGKIVAGQQQGRDTDGDITVFDSTGLALQDVSLSQWIYEKAVHLNKGRVLSLYG